jgi:carboxyl-terminal processing protease
MNCKIALGYSSINTKKVIKMSKINSDSMRQKNNCFFMISILVFIINVFPGYKSSADNESDQLGEDGYKDISQLMNVMQLIREKYVDVDKVTYDKLVKNAIQGMLMGLDPFSSYMEPKFYKEMVKETNGVGFGGLGIHIAIKNGKLVIIAPIHGSPAYKAGIKPNDTVLFIDGKPTSRMSEDECIKHLKGEPGSTVKLTIHRANENLTKEVTVVREIITPATVKWGYIQDANLGYVRISLFTKMTAEDLDKALSSLKEKGITGLIIDVRGNPGGLLDAAVDVSSRFIEKDKLIVFVEGRSQSERRDYYSIDCEKLPDIPIAILVNGMSASAAEILSGCLQDHKRAVLIGETTFGKGSVQSIIPQTDESAIRLTTAKYYTPSKRVIHEHGIEPNVIVDIDTPTANKLYSQCIAYPGVVNPDFSGAVRDLQLERAIEILKGIRLFKKSAE